MGSTLFDGRCCNSSQLTFCIISAENSWKGLQNLQPKNRAIHVAYNEQTLVSIFWSKRESLSTFSSFFWEHADCECFRQFLEKDVVVVKDFKTIHILRKHLLGERRVIKWQFLLTSSTKNMLTWGRGSQNMCFRNIWMVPLCKVGQIKTQGTTLFKMSLISLHLARNFSGHSGKPILSRKASDEFSWKLTYVSKFVRVR